MPGEMRRDRQNSQEHTLHGLVLREVSLWGKSYNGMVWLYQTLYFLLTLSVVILQEMLGTRSEGASLCLLASAELLCLRPRCVVETNFVVVLQF